MANCPICQKVMLQEQKSGVTIDACVVHGIWLDKAELLVITEDERHKNSNFVLKELFQSSFILEDLFRSEKKPPVNRDRKLPCPICQGEMKIDEYKSVHIDCCKEHGIWLDEGELEAILNNLRLDPMYLNGATVRLFELKF
jgi:Zn-finger nucleic acid-binding protein